MIESVLISMLYVAFSIFVSSKAKSSRLNETQLFLISILLSPVIGMLFLIFTKKPHYYYVYQYKCPHCKYYFTESMTICPQCKIDGYKIQLNKVKRMMT
ncbi:MAG: hypothetical protein KKB74_02210 [Bacteroidetes bacterium]|nr:hypothetical protein [Bacteroidota bacterium]